MIGFRGKPIKLEMQREEDLIRFREECEARAAKINHMSLVKTGVGIERGFVAFGMEFRRENRILMEQLAGGIRYLD